MPSNDDREQHWRKTIRITALLLAIWFIVSFVVSYFARDLSFSFLGWPFSFWMGAQGALLIYVVLIGVYARYMRKLDARYGIDER